MLVFSQARLVFLSVPKTGTTAWQAALEHHAAMVVRDPPELKHAPVFRYNRFFRPALEKFLGGPLTVLAVMREPIDWLGSWYRYRRRAALDGAANSTQGISFDEFVSAYCTGRPPAYARVGSQAKFLEPHRNGTRVTHLFRYEDQAGFRAFLEERLGTTITTATENISPEMPLSLTARSKARLRETHAEDFALWENIARHGIYRPSRQAPGRHDAG